MSDLPDFKFDLEKAKGWSGEAGSARQHTVDDFPVSQSFAAVSMRLQPGALRELHWHAIAAEWAYVISRPLPRDRHRALRKCRDFGLRTRRRMVFSEGPRAFDSRPRAGRVSFSARVRRRPILRVRDVQHHRLDVAHAAGRAGAKS